MFSVGATGNPVYPQKSTDEQPTIIQKLVAALIPRPDEEFQPVTGAWDALLQLKSSAADMTREQKERVESILSATLEEVTNSSPDAALLKDVVHSVLGPANWAPEKYLAARAYEGLCLPGLELLETNKEPDSRTFNSILPSLAAAAYDHGVLGRTLLWKGACQLFPGPRNAERSDKLRQVIFSFPNPPQPGEKKLEQLWEFCMAVGELGLDEEVDVDTLRQQQNQP